MAIVAGILFCHGDEYLFLKRAKDESWDLPGGHVEESETPKEGAIRETREEIGIQWNGDLEQISRTVNEDVDYTTFAAKVSEPFKPQLNEEHTDWKWATFEDMPKNAHPYLLQTIENLENQEEEAKNDAQEQPTELDIAKGIRDGELSSPQKFGNIWLFALRISGTGVSFRRKDNEFVYRNPDFYISDEFLARCNGLPVILEHPPGDTLNQEEFAERAIGTIFLPYVNDEEKAPWGIAKIYDDEAAQMMVEKKLSTSPGVILKKADLDDKIRLDDGLSMLVEGKPILLDHLAIVPNGVWDKGGEPSGVQVEMTATSRKDSANPNGSFKGDETMAQEIKHEPQAEQPASVPPAEAKKDEGVGLPEIMAMLQQIAGRIDKLESGEAKEEAKMPGIHDNAATMPSEPLPTPGQPAPTAADAETPNLAARIDALEETMKGKSVSDEDAAKMADAQAKADSVYSAFGKQAPRPLDGEKHRAYRVRLINGLKAAVKSFSDVDFGGITDKGAFKMMEKQFYTAAMDAAAHPTDMPEGSLREIKKDYGTGRTITEFVGDIGVTFAPFKAQKRIVTKFNKDLH